MQFKLILLSVLLLSSLSFAGEKADSGLAIDEADKIVPDLNSDCDHTNTGLNGVLHRAFANKSSSKDSNTDSSVNNQSENKQSKNKPAESSQSALTKDNDEKKEISKAQTKLVVSDEFSSAQELQLLKFNLLAKAAFNCAKGFTLDAERYLSTANKNLKLELVYQCL